jgi:4a-hydroxytetrahydrobiopterin dehydratase
MEPNVLAALITGIAAVAAAYITRRTGTWRRSGEARVQTRRSISMSRPQKLTEAEIQERLATLPDWTIEGGMLTRKFRFKTFMEGIAFVNKVAALAEVMNHHPDINIRFGLITISLITHGAQGLTDLDFTQAARLDMLAST